MMVWLLPVTPTDRKNLSKIVLTTFASNEGLRQNGDSSYLSSAKSGAAAFGEAGTAGFGTIRAGARERSNGFDYGAGRLDYGATKLPGERQSD